MKRTPFAIAHRVSLAVDWYGDTHDFHRQLLNDYNEPYGITEYIQSIRGIYHSSERSFVELINTEGASVKSKVNKGILCGPIPITVQQGDFTHINDVKYYVTACEYVMYGDVKIGLEISLEEFVEGTDYESRNI